MRRLLVWALLSVAAFAQSSTNIGGTEGAQQVFNGTLYANAFGSWSVPQGDAGQFTWSNPNICTSLQGLTFRLFVVGLPITIVDANPALTENTTITAVHVLPSQCNIVTAPLVNQHYSFRIVSGTFGVQEAINYAKQNNLATTVHVTQAWTRLGGQTSMITGAQGNANIGILDERNTVALAFYAWNGATYNQIPIGTAAQPILCTFSTPTTNWSCAHNLGTLQVQVEYLNLTSTKIFPDSPGPCPDVNTCNATFLQPQAGYMLISFAGNVGQTQTNPNPVVINPVSSQTITGNQPLNVTGPTTVLNNTLTVTGDNATSLGGSLSAKRILGCSTVYAGGPFANIQAAVTDAGTTGCVFILGSYAGIDSYTNPSNINVVDLRNLSIALNHLGLFTNTSYNSYLQSIVNGCNPATEDTVTQGGNWLTDGLTVCITEPATGTQYQVNGIAAFARSSASTNGTNNNGGTVALFGQAHATGGGTNGPWGFNTVTVVDTGTAPRSVHGGEIDIDIGTTQPTGGVTGLQFAGSTGVALPAGSQVISMGPLAAGFPWPTGILMGTGTATTAMTIGQLSTAAFVNSMPVIFVANNGVPAAVNTTIQSDFLGDFIVQSGGSTGGRFLGPHFGTTTANIASVGAVQLASGDQACWRNNANNGDLCVSKTAGDVLQFNGVTLTLTVGSGNVTTAGTAISAGNTQTANVTVSGALTTDSCTANIGSALPATWQSGITFRCDITSAGTATVELTNPTAGSITPAAQQVNVRVTR